MTTIAVCLASFRGEQFISEQVASILAQLGGEDLLFVSDDCSDDATLAILRSFGSRVRVVGSNRAGGIVPNFERVLQYAYDSGAEIFVLSDQDDVWLPGRLDAIRNGLQTSDLLMLNGYVTDERLIATSRTIFEAVGVRHGFWRNFWRSSYVGCCMAFKRSVLQLALPFPSKLPWHDWYLGLIGELFFKVGRIAQPTIFYRRHSSANSGTGEKSRYSFGAKVGMRWLIAKAMTATLLRRLRLISSHV